MSQKNFGIKSDSPQVLDSNFHLVSKHRPELVQDSAKNDNQNKSICAIRSSNLKAADIVRLNPIHKLQG